MSIIAKEPYLYQEVAIVPGKDKFLGEIVTCVLLEYLTSFARETHYGDEEEALMRIQSFMMGKTKEAVKVCEHEELNRLSFICPL